MKWCETKNKKLLEHINQQMRENDLKEFSKVYNKSMIAIMPGFENLQRKI